MGAYDTVWVVTESKSVIRKRVRALRDAVPAEPRAEWTKRIVERAIGLAAYQSARTVHIFLSFQSEVDTRAIIEHAFAHGKRVVVPVFVKDSDETPCTEILSLGDSEFTFGKWGLRTPRVIRLVPLEAIDQVFVPMVAWAELALPRSERAGVRGEARVARIGYGAGFYDRFLNRLRPDVPKIGLAFEMQRVKTIPVNPSDAPLDMIITEAN